SLRDVVAADYVAHLHARVRARVLFAPRAPNLDAIVCYALALLLQDRDHVNRCAASERDEQKLDGRRGARAFFVRLKHLRVATRRYADEETVARRVDDRHSVRFVHEWKPPCI